MVADQRGILARLVAAQERLAAVRGGLDETLQAVADEAAAMFAERSVVGLVDGEHVVARAVGGSSTLMAEGDRLPVEGTLAGHVLATGEVALCRDAETDPRTDPEASRRYGVRSSVIAPIRHADEVLGLLVVTAAEADGFDEVDAEAVVLLAALAGGAVAAALARKDRQSMQGVLSESLRRLDAASEVSGAGTWEWDLATGALVWSEQMYRIAGARPGEIEPTIEAWTALLHPADRDRATARREDSLGSRRGYRERFRIIDLTGRVRRLLAWSEVEVDAQGTPVRVVGATLDAGEVEDPTLADPLTGLPSRALLDERLADALVDAGGNAGPGLLVVELDRFRLVNEAVGRETGDRVLTAAASRIITTCPAGSTVVRVGGDEFAVLVPSADDQRRLTDLADRLVRAFREPYRSAGVPDGTVCTATVGVTWSPGAGGAGERDPGEIVREADLALHRAKTGGGNRWAVFDAAMGAAAAMRARTEESLRSALDAERLRVVYQPVVSLRTGRVVGVEALARVVDPELGPLSPALFVEAAEQTGLVARLDAWVLRRAVALAAGWPHDPGAGSDDRHRLRGGGRAGGGGEPVAAHPGRPGDRRDGDVPACRRGAAPGPAAGGDDGALAAGPGGGRRPGGR